MPWLLFLLPSGYTLPPPCDIPFSWRTLCVLCLCLTVFLCMLCYLPTSSVYPWEKRKYILPPSYSLLCSCRESHVWLHACSVWLLEKIRREGAFREGREKPLTSLLQHWRERREKNIFERRERAQAHCQRENLLCEEGWEKAERNKRGCQKRKRTLGGAYRRRRLQAPARENVQKGAFYGRSAV